MDTALVTLSLNAQKCIRSGKRVSKVSFYDPFIRDSKFGTVGCVALDKSGNLAAGTSPGNDQQEMDRIGDAPIIGAEPMPTTTAVSASHGLGEFFTAL